MKNKYIYILILIISLLIVSVYYMISYLNNNFDKKYNVLIKNKVLSVKNTNDFNIKEKLINLNIVNINPDIYDSLDEFLNYFNSWSWVILNVDLLKEDFYINKYTDDWFIITRFDKELISYIDDLGNKNIKNQAIIDIYNSYKTDKYILWEPNDGRTGVRLLEQHELPSNMQFHNNILLPYKGESSIEATNRLENKENKTNDDKQQLSYLYDFSWDYKKSLELKESLGVEKITYKIKWRVYSLWNTLSWAKIELLNYDDISILTNEKWEYELEFETYPLTRLRLRATYNDLSDWYNWVYVVFDYDNQLFDDVDFSLHIYNTKELVKSEDLVWLNKKIVKSTIWNSFEFKKWVLIDSNWKIHSWDFNVEIFEFNRNTPWMESFLTLDNFDELYWYTWNMMITNGMTYLLIRDLVWNELFISKQNPIITRQKVDIDYLLNNKQNWTNVFTESQLKLILDKSKEDWYLVDNKFLSDRNITWFSPWWVLNRTRWVWENNGIKLLNKSWLKESLYYNVD